MLRSPIERFSEGSKLVAEVRHGECKQNTNSTWRSTGPGRTARSYLVQQVNPCVPGNHCPSSECTMLGYPLAYTAPRTAGPINIVLYHRGMLAPRLSIRRLTVSASRRFECRVESIDHSLVPIAHLSRVYGGTRQATLVIPFRVADGH